MADPDPALLKSCFCDLIEKFFHYLFLPLHFAEGSRVPLAVPKTLIPSTPAAAQPLCSLFHSAQDCARISVQKTVWFFSYILASQPYYFFKVFSFSGSSSVSFSIRSLNPVLRSVYQKHGSWLPDVTADTSPLPPELNYKFRKGYLSLFPHK